MKDSVISQRTATAMLIAFVLFEGPVRMTMATDPWLVDGNHWYFNQPARLALEALFVLSVGAVLWATGQSRLLFHRVGKTHLFPLLFWCGLIAALFTVARVDRWLPLIEPPIIGATLLWFATGLFIGIGQELTFRGLLFTGLGAFLNRYWTWALSIFIFVVAPLHSYRLFIYWQDGRDERALFLAFVYLMAGILFTWLRARTQSLLVPGLIHALANALTFSLTFTLVGAATGP